jgi:hypothetical protein
VDCREWRRETRPFRDTAKPVAGERFLRRRCDVSGIAPLGGNLKRKGVKVEAWGLRDTKGHLVDCPLTFLTIL